MHCWFRGGHAMDQLGGRDWKSWRPAMEKAVAGSQRAAREAAGSWEPVGPWGHAGGGVYSTAMLVLTLEAEFACPRLLGRR